MSTKILERWYKTVVPETEDTFQEQIQFLFLDDGRVSLWLHAAVGNMVEEVNLSTFDVQELRACFDRLATHTQQTDEQRQRIYDQGYQDGMAQADADVQRVLNN